MTKHDVKLIIVQKRGNDGKQSSLLQIILSHLMFRLHGKMPNFCYACCENEISFMYFGNLILISYFGNVKSLPFVHGIFNKSESYNGNFCKM
jgi:hypothetical protein